MTFMDVTMTGYAGRDAEEPDSGPAARIRIAHTPRKRDQATGEWSDNGSTIWVTVQCWSEESRSFANLMRVRKGDQVLAIGKLTMNSWEDSDGNTRVDWQLNHPEVVQIVQKTNGDSNGHAPRPDSMEAAGLSYDRSAEGETFAADDDVFAD